MSGYYYYYYYYYYYFYIALMTVFLLLEDPRAVAGAWNHKVNTSNSLRSLTECRRTEQLQIVDVVFDQPNKSLPISDLIAIYNTVDEAAGKSESDREVINSRAKEKLGRIEDRLGENFTVHYFCVSGGEQDAVNPCSQKYMTRPSVRSVMLREPHLECSRHCILKRSGSTGIRNIEWNFLVNQTQQFSFKVAYSTNGGQNEWQCLDTLFNTQLMTRNAASLHLQFSWPAKLNLTRLWFWFGGVPFDIKCDYVEDRTFPTCSSNSTTRTTSKSIGVTSVSSNVIRTPQTPQSDNLTQMIIVVAPVAGVVIIVIIVAVAAVYLVKKRSQDPARQTNPGTNLSGAVTNAQFEPSPSTGGGAFMFHSYSVLQLPPPPETGTADPKEDAAKNNRKRKAYCHDAADYEEWDFQKIARERAAIQNNV